MRIKHSNKSSFIQGSVEEEQAIRDWIWRAQKIEPSLTIMADECDEYESDVEKFCIREYQSNCPIELKLTMLDKWYKRLQEYNICHFVTNNVNNHSKVIRQF